MDGFLEISDADFSSMEAKRDLDKIRLEELKKVFCSSIGNVYMRNLEYTTKKNDRRVFKVEFASENTGVLFSTLDDSNYLFESSLYIPFNTNGVPFLSSLILKEEPIESFRIRYFEKRLEDVAKEEEILKSKIANMQSLRGHCLKQIEIEKERLKKGGL